MPHSEQPTGTVLLAFGGRGQPEAEPLITLKPNAVVRGPKPMDDQSGADVKTGLNTNA